VPPPAEFDPPIDGVPFSDARRGPTPEQVAAASAWVQRVLDHEPIDRTDAFEEDADQSVVDELHSELKWLLKDPPQGIRRVDWTPFQMMDEDDRLTLTQSFRLAQMMARYRRHLFRRSA